MKDRTRSERNEYTRRDRTRSASAKRTARNRRAERALRGSKR
jgi:hypothetical protein